MPKIIDYPQVLRRMTEQGFVCNYPNSGAFGFPHAPEYRGWIGPEDSTIKPAFRDLLRKFPAPYEANLASSATDVWQKLLPGPVWLMPMSHWHFELHDGSRTFLADRLAEIHVDATALTDRADGSALEFDFQESAEFRVLVQALLEGLRGSDFLLAFPDRPVLCVIHHHKQLWWVSSDSQWLARIDAAV